MIIQTAVQSTVIPPLGSGRRLRKALKRIRECVEAVQVKSTKASIQEDLTAWSGANGKSDAAIVHRIALMLERDAALPWNEVILAEALRTGLIVPTCRVDDQLEKVVGEGV